MRMSGVLSEFGFFFFFQQKTAYELRISDWSSDVCSSDLFKPLYGTGVSLTPKSRLSHSAYKCPAVALPPDPAVMAWPRPCSTKSATVRIGERAFTTSTLDNSPTMPIGASAGCRADLP